DAAGSGERNRRHKQKKNGGNEFHRRTSLLVAEGLDGVEFRGAGGGIEAGDEADDDGETYAEENEPERNRRNFDAGEFLALQVNVGGESKRAADQPAKDDA